MMSTIMSYQPTMAVVFAAMLLALLAGWFNRHRLAVTCLFICLFLAIWQFLFEIYDPKTGFRMPWIQTENEVTPRSLADAG